MPNTRFPRLSVESIEDRLLPAPLAFAPPVAAALAVRGDFKPVAVRPVEMKVIELEAADVRQFEVRLGEFRAQPMRFESLPWRDDRIATFLTPERFLRAAEPLRTIFTPPQPESPGEAVSGPAGFAAQVRAFVNRAAATVAFPVAGETPNVSPPSTVNSGVSATANFDVRYVVPPTGAAAVDAGSYVISTVAEAAVPDAETTPPPDAVPTLPVIPVPQIVERVMGIALPAVAPVVGALPFDAAAVEAGATALLTRIAEWGGETADDLGTDDRWEWLTAAIIVVGATVYSSRAARGRRKADVAVLGTASALARWEGSRADRPE